jgi:ComEC/Rec2-related protein
MSRGRFSYFFLFALSLWATLFFSQAVSGLSFLVLGFGSFAFSVTVSPVTDPRWKRRSLVFGFLGLGVLIGGFRAQVATNSVSTIQPPKFFTGPPAYMAIQMDRVEKFHGILSGDSTAVPRSSEVLIRYPVKLEQVVGRAGELRGSAGGEILVWVRGGQMMFKGQEIIVEAEPAPSRAPGRFAYVCWADRGQIQAGGFRRPVDSLRAEFFSTIQTRIRNLEPPVAALLSALLLGGREELPYSLYQQFRYSGSLHLLALSGLHLGVLYFFLSGLLRIIQNRRIRGLVVSALLLVYVFLVGWRPSLERALVMLVMAGLGYALDRELNPLNLLCLAASILLILHPYYAFDLSFQLSFVSLLAILLLGPYLHRIWQPYLPKVIGWPLAISLSAQIGTAPLVLFHFGAVHPVGVAAALVLIPLITLFLGAGLLFVGLSLLPIHMSTWTGEGLLLLYRSITFSLRIFARLPALHLQWRSLYWCILAVLLIPFLLELSIKRSNRIC